MNGSVLVPVADMLTSSRALQVAASLARQLGASLQLLHVHFSTAPFSSIPARPEDPLDAAVREIERSNLQRTATELRRQGAASVEVTMLDGGTVDTITRYAALTNAHYVIMNARGADTGLLSWRGIAERVAMDTHLPAIVIPAAANLRSRDYRIRRMLVPLDGSEHGEAVLGPVIELARLEDTAVTVLHVLRRDAYPYGFIDSCLLSSTDADHSDRHCAEQYLESVIARLRGHGVHAQAIVMEHPDVVATIRSEASRLGADMIALACDSRPRLFPGSPGQTIRSLIRQGPLPLLLCNGPLARSTPLSSEIEMDLATR
jgi:nucleotide-binding universal stress UspA family protein